LLFSADEYEEDPPSGADEEEAAFGSDEVCPLLDDFCYFELL
jgi:hypothetical protein